MRKSREQEALKLPKLKERKNSNFSQSFSLEMLSKFGYIGKSSFLCWERHSQYIV